VVTHQLQVDRAWDICQPETKVLPLCHATYAYLCLCIGYIKLTDVTQSLRWRRPILPSGSIKNAFHGGDTDILAGILADTSDTRDFLKLFLWQAE